MHSEVYGALCEGCGALRVEMFMDGLGGWGYCGLRHL